MCWLILSVALWPALVTGAGVEEPAKLRFSAELVEVRIAQRTLAERRQVITYEPKKVREAAAPVLVVGLDARWLVKARIARMDGGDPLFSKGELVSFIVHSPVQVLGPHGMIDVGSRQYGGLGKTLRFELTVESSGEARVKFDQLRVVPEKSKDEEPRRIRGGS